VVVHAPGNHVEVVYEWREHGAHRTGVPKTVVQDGAMPALDEELFAELFSLMGENFGGFVSVFIKDTPVAPGGSACGAANHDANNLISLPTC